MTNLSASLGTALAGSIIIAAVASSFLANIQQSPATPPEVESQAQVELAGAGPFVSDADLEAALERAARWTRKARPPCSAPTATRASTAGARRSQSSCDSSLNESLRPSPVGQRGRAGGRILLGDSHRSLGVYGPVGLGLVALVVLTGCSRESEQASAGTLVEAAARSDAAAVRELLERGAEVNERDATGRTPVTAAVYARSREVVRLLIAAGADVDLQDDTRANAFLALGETGDVAMLEEVLSAEPDVTLTNRFGGTALIPAADRGHVEMVRALLERTKVDVDHVNDLGWTALLEAVILGEGGRAHQRIVRLLLEAGADPTIADREGATPLEHARTRGYDRIASILEEAGAIR